MNSIKDFFFLRWPLAVFLVLYIIFSILTYSHYGITTDEQYVYTRGKQFFEKLILDKPGVEQEFITKGEEKNDLLYYANIYAAVLYAFNQGQSYELYHLFNLLFGSIFFILAYEFLLYFLKNEDTSKVRQSKHWRKEHYAILGPIFLFFTPRILGHIPANPKDMPFAVVYLLTIFLILLSKNWHKSVMCLVLGVSFGFTQALRTVGLSVHIVYLIYRFFIDDEKNLNLPSKIYHIFIDWLIILLISYLVYIFNIPYLGIDPIHHFFELIGVGSAFPSNGIETLTLGKIYLSETQPWFYLPIWILFTTPVFILALFFYSLFKFKKESRVFFLLFLALVVNLAIFYLVDPNIYNGLRHMLFLLPFMVILSVIGLWKLKNIKYFTVIVVFIVVNIILVFYSYFTLYPYQYIYFNQFAGGLKGAYGNFETDYWSASSREAAIWLKENVADKTDKMISVYSCSASQLSEYYFSPNMQIVYDKDLADYFICWERYNHFKNLQQRFAGEVIYTVDRQGVPLIYIYKKNYAQY